MLICITMHKGQVNKPLGLVTGSGSLASVNETILPYSHSMEQTLLSVPLTDEN